MFPLKNIFNTNKVRTINYLILSLFFTWALCSSGSSLEHSYNNASFEKGKKVNFKSKNNARMNAFFENHKDSIQTLLTKEDVLQYIAIDNPDLLKDEYIISRQKLKFTYESDRADEFQSKAIPEINSITLHGFKVDNNTEKKTLASFERTYRSLTQKEIDIAITNLEKGSVDKPKEALEHAKRFIEARKNMKYKPIDHLGTAAYWQEIRVKDVNYGVELIVLAGVTQFKLEVKIDEDNQVNLKTAVNLANEILKKSQS